MNIYYTPPSQIMDNEFIFQDAKNKLSEIKNTRTRVKMATIIIGIVLSNINELMAKDLKVYELANRIDKTGNQALELIQTIGYWSAVILAGIDVIRNIKKQDISGAFALVLKYVFINELLHALPWIFSVFRDLFN